MCYFVRLPQTCFGQSDLDGFAVMVEDTEAVGVATAATV